MEGNFLILEVTFTVQNCHTISLIVKDLVEKISKNSFYLFFLLGSCLIILLIFSTQHFNLYFALT